MFCFWKTTNITNTCTTHAHNYVNFTGQKLEKKIEVHDVLHEIIKDNYNIKINNYCNLHQFKSKKSSFENF